MFCKNCGHLIQKNFRVCPRCSAPAKKKKRKPAAGILILFALCFGIIAAVFLGGCQSDKSLAGTEKGTSRTQEEASQIVLSDIPQEDWEIFMDSTEYLSTIVSGYSGENGFVSPQDTEAVMNAVAEEVDRLYREGIVSFYSCQEDVISFEYASGLTAFYSPSLEGNASGGDDVILALDPYETDSTNVTMTNKAAVSGSYITDALENYQMDAYENSEVTLDLLRNLPTCSAFLWNGHGYVVTQYQHTYSVLLTGEKADGLAKYSGLSLSADKVLAAVGNVNYWAITPFFVEEYISLDQGLAYLSACFSGANDLMAAAFVNSGTEAVFVNVGSCEVSTFYTQSIMEYVIGHMAGCYSIEVYGENTYTLNYECQGYQSASHEFAATEDMGQSVQSGISVLLDDVFLEQDENVVSAESGQYWVVFREGFRNSRIELSVVSSPVSRDSLCIIWDKSMTLNNTEGMSKSSQYYLTEAGAWKYMREYHRLTDYATAVIASSLDIYDADGNLILAASDYNDLDLTSLTE